MPRNFQTTGDLAHDFELDQLWGQLARLVAQLATGLTPPPPASAPDVPPVPVAGSLTVTPLGSDVPTIYAQSLQFDPAADLLVTDASPIAQIGRTPNTSPPAAVGAAAAAGTSAHAANADHVHAGVASLVGGTNGMITVSAATGALTVTGTVPLLAADPGSPANGDCWLNSTTLALSVKTAAGIKRVTLA